jgi:hypothetical protein
VSARCHSISKASMCSVMSPRCDTNWILSLSAGRLAAIQLVWAVKVAGHVELST